MTKECSKCNLPEGIVAFPKKRCGSICQGCLTAAARERRRAKSWLREQFKQKKECARRPYIIHKKPHCDDCGFLAVHPCQLDIDHIDGNHFNNLPHNLQTLCANCHRIKTLFSQDTVKHKEDVFIAYANEDDNNPNVQS